LSREMFIMRNTGVIDDYYDIDSTVGQGTFGTVHRGTHNATGSSRAVKIIPRRKADSSARVREEVSIMKLLDHPNIIRLYETFEDCDSMYLVMELCRGGELFDRILAQGSLSERQAAMVLQHALRAVAHMHQKDIAHRDLKPENFLFSSDGPIEQNVLKIVDFGTACVAGPDTIMNSLVGTRYYVAPQVVMRRYDRKCDEWSCGAIMYTLLSGDPPFSGRTDREVLQKVRLGKYTFDAAAWKSVSEEAKQLIRMLMNANGRARWSASQALGHAWIRRQPPQASPTSLEAKGRIMQNLQSFHEQNRLKKAALQIIAGQLNDDQGRRLMEAFTSLDTDGDGLLSFEEVREGLRKASFEDMEKDVERVVRGIDVNFSGTIDYTEFVAAALDRSQGISERDCRSAFVVFDLDGDGKITIEEITQVLDHGTPNTSSMELVRSFDSDGDGSIDFEEFKAMMGAVPELKDLDTTTRDDAISEKPAGFRPCAGRGAGFPGDVCKVLPSGLTELQGDVTARAGA